MVKRTRSVRGRTTARHRELTSSPVAAAPLPAAAATREPTPPRPEAPAITKITTTDYGYVAGELRRIALLTAVILAILLAFWVAIG
ncbi:MAG: hypothetical protein C4290_02620 [Chloroflexota bacterium]